MNTSSPSPVMPPMPSTELIAPEVMSDPIVVSMRIVVSAVFILAIAGVVWFKRTKAGTPA